MNIYDCFSPTILIIYRYFQFSSSGSTTERRAFPGVLKRMHNNVASRLLASLGLGRVSPCRAGIGMQSRAARQELREPRCLRQPRWLLQPWAGLGEALLQPLRPRRAAAARPSGGRGAGPSAGRVAGPRPGLLPLRALRHRLAQRQQGLLLSDPNAVLQLEGCVPLLSGVLFGLGL